MNKTQILVPHGAIKKLALDTGHTPTTVRFSLRGMTDTEASRLIRKRAIEAYGGVKLKKGK